MNMRMNMNTDMNIMRESQSGACVCKTVPVIETDRTVMILCACQNMMWWYRCRRLYIIKKSSSVLQHWNAVHPNSHSYIVCSKSKLCCDRKVHSSIVQFGSRSRKHLAYYFQPTIIWDALILLLHARTDSKMGRSMCPNQVQRISEANNISVTHGK